MSAQSCRGLGQRQQVSRGLRRDSELAGWLDSLDDLRQIALALTEADYYRKVARAYVFQGRDGFDGGTGDEMEICLTSHLSVSHPFRKKRGMDGAHGKNFCDQTSEAGPGKSGIRPLIA